LPNYDLSSCPGAISSLMDKAADALGARGVNVPLLYGGSGSGCSARANIADFERYRIVPSYIHENVEPILSTRILGKQVGTPLMIAPMSGLALSVNPKIMQLFAEAAREAGAILLLGCPLPLDVVRECAKIHDKVAWIVKPEKNGKTVERVREAERAGCFAVGVDVDCSRGVDIAGHVICQEWNSLGENEIGRLAHETALPFIVKGVLAVEDAVSAIDAGASAIYVSNHGGRVMDYNPSPFSVLSEICSVANGNVEILVDGGFKSGWDVFKGLALGARGVAVGRAALASVATHAEAQFGARAVFNIINGELSRVMGQLGIQRVSGIERKFVRQVV